MRWPDRLLRRLSGHITGRRDYLDGLRDGVLMGWAAPREGDGPVRVELAAGGVVLARGTACQMRGDLTAAGLGACGFSFPLADLRERISELGGVVQVVRCDGARRVAIGQIRLSHRVKRAERSRPVSELRAALEPGLAVLRGEVVAVDTAPRGVTPWQAGLFDAPRSPGLDPGPLGPHGGPGSGSGAAAQQAPPLFPYASFTRARYRLEDQFDWDNAPEEVAHFLNWYLAGYAPMRGSLRPPLSKAAIDWLNAPQIIGGQRVSLTRATWAFLMGVPHLLRDMDFANPDWVSGVVHWWSVHQARALGAEDCLVPEAYAALLAEAPKGEWPLSRYLERFRSETSGLPAAETAEARREIALAALVRAAEAPDTLRYLPEASIETLLAEDVQGQTGLGVYLSRLEDHPIQMPRTRFVAHLAARGYDMGRGRFTTITAEGHRLHAASLPAPVLHKPAVDVQVIGPVTKASGLGQAMRASLSALATTGLSVQVVNFGLDNPAPELDIPHVPFEAARPARFTLLHLNAETIPLLAAYAPDITQGSHVAAYMFWELTRPAACHSLALRMVDEIWVASDYGRAIYAPHFDGPVQVMGLACETPPLPDRAQARETLCAATGFDPDQFLCLATFDSFSFVQRKNPLALIRAFKDAFPEGGAQLLLKTQNRTRVSDPAQMAIWGEIDAVTRGDPRFHILDQTLPHDRLMALKTGADAYLSLHRSEGWGFGMIEAMALGVPVLATGASGNLAYCDDATAFLVPAGEVAPDPSDYIFTPEGGLWGEPDHNGAVEALRIMAHNPALRAAKAQAARTHVAQQFSAEAIGKGYAERIRKVLTNPTGRAA